MKLSKLERVREVVVEYMQEMNGEGTPRMPPDEQEPLFKAVSEMSEAHTLLRKAIDHYREYLERREMA